MAGRTDPPEGTPGGVSGAGDEEYRSTVFDESFVRAARLQEASAQERLETHGEAVRSRSPDATPGGSAGNRTVPKQGIALALIILLAFAAAIYLGSNNPYGASPAVAVEPPVGSVTPLAPDGAVPGSDDIVALYAASQAADFGLGEGGVSLPDPRATAHFTQQQVWTALTLAKEYVVASALTEDVVTGETSAPVRELLGEDQQHQFDDALAGSAAEHPDAADTSATDWLVRFAADPTQQRVALADPLPRVEGRFTFDEVSEGVIEVAGQHVFVYAVRPADAPLAPAALFTVERDIRLQFGEDQLRDRQVMLRQVDSLAGPMDCTAETAAAFDPLLAGERAAHSPAMETTDPYATRAAGATICGTLSASALPALPDT
ncbi:hypothetical protein [Streptomyces sp. B6B3]|uniref:SCO2583 family membrane protein n=1 Tax=Streptomyces sp. B6B3 TaxID=3153570 RepID=UPI00325E8774